MLPVYLLHVKLPAYTIYHLPSTIWHEEKQSRLPSTSTTPPWFEVFKMKENGRRSDLLDRLGQ